MLNYERFECNTPPKIQDEYVKVLTDRGVSVSPCIRCGDNSYGVLGASARHGVFGTNQLTVLEIPCVVIVCSNCGFKSEYSTQELGIHNE